MCNQKEKKCIHNINRVAIAGASLVAMLIDGVSTANCIYLASAIMWLFQPECDAAEEQVFDLIRQGKLRVVAEKLVNAVRTRSNSYYTQACGQEIESKTR